MFAARNGHEAVVRLLLSAGANPEMGDLEGNDAAKIASAAGNHLIAGLLQAAPGNR
jgi:ankyrin repeat protein